MPSDGAAPAVVTREIRPCESRIRSPSSVTIGSLPPVGKRLIPAADIWLVISNVHMIAAGPASRALRYAALPMKSADLTFGRASPASTGLYSLSSSAPIRR